MVILEPTKISTKGKEYTYHGEIQAKAIFDELGGNTLLLPRNFAPLQTIIPSIEHWVQEPFNIVRNDNEKGFKELDTKHICYLLSWREFHELCLKAFSKEIAEQVFDESTNQGD